MAQQLVGRAVRVEDHVLWALLPTTTAVQLDGATGRPHLALAVVLGLVLSLFPGIQHAHAAPDANAEARFVSLINAERANAGLPALKVAGDLTKVARRHSVRMAESGKLHHNANLGSEVSGWDKVGENVGRGPNVDRVHAAFMASDGHRRNILDPDWTEVGVGVEVVDGGLWVTEIFRLPSGASAPKPEPKPEPKAEPEPKPKPEPKPEAAPTAQAPPTYWSASVRKTLHSKRVKRG
jgi:uncharacterized protein YkwD